MGNKPKCWVPDNLSTNSPLQQNEAINHRDSWSMQTLFPPWLPALPADPLSAHNSRELLPGQAPRPFSRATSNHLISALSPAPELKYPSWCCPVWGNPLQPGVLPPASALPARKNGILNLLLYKMILRACNNVRLQPCRFPLTNWWQVGWNYLTLYRVLLMPSKKEIKAARGAAPGSSPCTFNSREDGLSSSQD